MAELEERVYAIAKLWVDGIFVAVDGAVLTATPYGWSIRAPLGQHNPYARQYGLSLQLADGRTAHGQARLLSAEGNMVEFALGVTIEGTIGPIIDGVSPTDHSNKTAKSGGRGAT